jgi:hypothetical protein
MTDEELIKRLREGQDLHVLAAIRIEELAMLRRTSALDALAAYGQAQDAYEAQLEAEARLAKVVDALEKLVTCVEDGCFCSEEKMAWVIDYANTTLARV